MGPDQTVGTQPASRKRGQIKPSNRAHSSCHNQHVFVVLPLAVAVGIAAFAGNQRISDDQIGRHWFIRLAALMVVGSALLQGVMHLYQGARFWVQWRGRSRVSTVLAVAVTSWFGPRTTSSSAIYAVTLGVAVAALPLPLARDDEARSQ